MQIKNAIANLMVVICSFIGMSAYAQFSPHSEKPDLDLNLIAKAIRSMSGYAEGVIRGQQAESLQAMTRSTEPLLASVRVVKRFEQFECARIEINVTQENVPTTSGAFITFSMPPLGMNICADGNPPDGEIEDLPKGNVYPDSTLLPR